MYTVYYTQDSKQSSCICTLNIVHYTQDSKHHSCMYTLHSVHYTHDSKHINRTAACIHFIVHTIHMILNI
jgi:hypothetical protein